MSIAILTQVYDETRRLAVAGSAVARGDFRLKKLLPPLDQAGAKAPVFAKVAESARAVVEGPEEASATNLLELASLVTAVLSTQGETGLAGTFDAIETTDLGGTTAQTSARLLKPLLEALRSTGSGRIELVKDGYERGAFRDLRLVKPALDGLDDPYAEIGEFLANKVIPIYGKAALPELRAKYDPKGTKGNPRRLKLMHALDPAGSRELVKEALDSGSKEVKVAAIACLGADRNDLPFLIEQAAAKARDVRSAAFHALATVEDSAAVAVLEKALAGKDWDLVASAIAESKSVARADLLVAEARKLLPELLNGTDKKAVSALSNRLRTLVRSLPANTHAAVDALTRDLFAQRTALRATKGETHNGSEVAIAAIARMEDGAKPLQVELAHAHAELVADDLRYAVRAARQALPPAEVYDLFAPYLTAKGDPRKGKDTTTAKRKAVLDAFNSHRPHYIYWYRPNPEEQIPFDPRWLDLAVKIENLGLIHAIHQPGHAGAEAFLRSEFAANFKSTKSSDTLHDVVAVMVRLAHPDAVEALIAAYRKAGSKPGGYSHWYLHLIAELPKSALPQLEAASTRLSGHALEHWVHAIEEVRAKP